MYTVFNLTSYLKISTPTAYTLKNSSNIQNGINFGYGGTGLFKTLFDGPNLTVQIDSFEQLIKQNVYNKSDVESSIFLVNSGGNDYVAFAVKDRNLFGIKKFMKSLIAEFSVNIRRIQNLGAQKIIVSLLPPAGCVPLISAVSLYNKCFDLLNSVTSNHNTMLLQVEQDLNKEFGKSVVRTLDIYSSFQSTIQTIQENRKDNSTLMNPLEPCCASLSAGYGCGNVDEKGNKKYTLCEKPELSFFWDSLHPSQNGWYSIFKQLEASLSLIIGGEI
ncbi:hypothetical protein Lal_00046941 [Lupinus albus]|uniref:Putative SGNH hydrolase-type esterase domain-containing protein n=1 Tax=Lupinus albus TaxID=3870 RepID=A0A6A5N7H4_LUPAL|nr:putative SGNH hydrolase-type esterase domain-containing protein [Lupinus albus]KAF1878275.1 hypothetical protein Lal_00046941 [Lupinus albus]